MLSVTVILNIKNRELWGSFVGENRALPVPAPFWENCSVPHVSVVSHPPILGGQSDLAVWKQLSIFMFTWDPGDWAGIILGIFSQDRAASARSAQFLTGLAVPHHHGRSLRAGISIQTPLTCTLL